MLSKSYSNKRHAEEGFTLIELLIVVIIIGILAAIALPIFINQQRIAVDASVQSDVRNSVTNIVNAQAQGASTAKAAASRVHTTLAIVDITDLAKSASVTRTAQSTDTTFSAVPTLGDSYTLQGFNPDGSKYQGLGDGLNGRAFTFTSATGQFTSTAATSDSNADGGNGGIPAGGGSSTTPANYTATMDADKSWDGLLVGDSYTAQAVKYGSGHLDTFTVEGAYDFANGVKNCPLDLGEGGKQEALDASSIHIFDKDNVEQALPTTGSWQLNISYRCENTTAADGSKGNFTGSYVQVEHLGEKDVPLPEENLSKVQFDYLGKTYFMSYTAPAPTTGS